MKVALCDENRRADWERLVAGSADATNGHLWQWRAVVGCAYGYRPFYLIAENDRGEAIAGAPFIFVKSFIYGNELVSMPYLDYGGICHRDGIAAAEREDADTQLLARAHELAKHMKAKRLHVRSLDKMPHPFELSTEKVAQHLPLASRAEEQLKLLPSERRNRLKRCEKIGLKTEIVDPGDAAKLEEFFAVYSENMRDLGSPTHGREYFRQVTSQLREFLALILIRYDHRVIAAGLAFEFKGSMGLPWSGANLQARPLYGTNALYWSAIRLGIERGCHTFDFGRSTVDSGIFEFKRQWGPKAVQPYWSTLYLTPNAAAPRSRKSLQTISKIWRYMPIRVARSVGPGLRRGISN